MKCDYLTGDAACGNENSDPSGLCAIHRRAQLPGNTIRSLKAENARLREDAHAFRVERDTALAAQKAAEERALSVEGDRQKALAALDLLRKQNAIGFCAALLLRGYCVREKGHAGHHYPSIEDVIEELEGEKRAHAAHHAAENAAPQAPAAGQAQDILRQALATDQPKEKP